VDSFAKLGAEFNTNHVLGFAKLNLNGYSGYFYRRIVVKSNLREGRLMEWIIPFLIKYMR
jgi:hypothetical protein